MTEFGAMDTLFPNFGKAAYFQRTVSTNGWRVLPDEAEQELGISGS
jgi:hypothetical protein